MIWRKKLFVLVNAIFLNDLNHTSKFLAKNVTSLWRICLDCTCSIAQVSDFYDFEITLLKVKCFFSSQNYLMTFHVLKRLLATHARSHLGLLELIEDVFV